MNHTPLRIAVLISGGGTNLQSLIDSSAMPDFPAKIVTVISNKRDAYGLTRAKNAGIKTHAITKKEFPNTDAFELRLNALLDEHNIDVICLAGFMRILSPGFTQKWESRILNIHPSLLPKYGGQGMYGMHVHNAVVAAGEKESGATVHLVTADCDEGPIILQKSVPLEEGDTAEDVAARVLKIEHEIYPQALKTFASGFIKT